MRTNTAKPSPRPGRASTGEVSANTASTRCSSIPKGRHFGARHRLDTLKLGFKWHLTAPAFDNCRCIRRHAYSIAGQQIDCQFQIGRLSDTRKQCTCGHGSFADRNDRKDNTVGRRQERDTAILRHIGGPIWFDQGGTHALQRTLGHRDSRSRRSNACIGGVQLQSRGFQAGVNDATARSTSVFVRSC